MMKRKEPKWSESEAELILAVTIVVCGVAFLALACMVEFIAAVLVISTVIVAGCALIWLLWETAHILIHMYHVSHQDDNIVEKPRYSNRPKSNPPPPSVEDEFMCAEEQNDG